MKIFKKSIFFFLAIIFIAAFVFSFHVIRVDEGIEIIRKDGFTHRDFYVDVRNFGLVDYFHHLPKIRNYLFFDKPYKKLLSLIEEKKAELGSSGGYEQRPRGALADRIEPIEKSMRKWMEKIRD